MGPLEELRRIRIQQINAMTSGVLETEKEKTAFSEQNYFQFRHRRTDGSIREIEVFSNKIEIAEKAFLYSSIHDITERKEAENELRIRSEDLETLSYTAMGRELRMIELKKEINDLCADAGTPQRYVLAYLKENGV
jgi:PAS domain-containing protein